MQTMIGNSGQTGTPAADWNELALGAGTPFMSHEWLSALVPAFELGDCEWSLLRDSAGALRACTCVLGARGAKLASTTNAHSLDWEILARDEQSCRELAHELVARGANRVQLRGMQADGPSARALAAELDLAGYRTVSVPGPFCPWLELPSSWEELSEGISGSLRSQVRRRRKMLEGEGTLSFRVSRGEDGFEEDLETFLKLEASGWKGRDGTAILSRPSTARLYREFARGAAAQGWLRLYLLELDGAAIAADYGCAFAGTGYFLKTGFDERHARLSPGLILRAEVLRSSIEEGLGGYDFLGDADSYKTRWTAATRPRRQLWAYRGPALAGYAYRKRLRPLLKAARGRALELRERAGRKGAGS
jgi:Acetyltransferase (GNAT) domain